jgi:hypothetical protein
LAAPRTKERRIVKRAGIIAALSLLLVALSASPALASQTTTIDPANAPSGTHLQTGTIGCTVTGQSVSCSSFELAGVGHTNATLDLVATYTATIDCRNHGGNVVESHSQDVAVESGPVTLRSTKNGRLTVPEASVDRPTRAEFLAQATCPNPNWTPEIRAGTRITLESFTYTLTFEGFSGAYITITGNDP